jgi:hypothetical protein
MTKSEYRRECLLRSSAFHTSVLDFHRRYPRVFVRDPVHPRRVAPPSWLIPYVLNRADVWVGRIDTIDQLRLLGGLAAETLSISGWHRLLPEDGSAYFTALDTGSSPEQYTAEWQALCQTWSDVSLDAMRFPGLMPGDRPVVVVGPFQGLPAEVVVAIPIYGDTTDRDKEVTWKAAMRLKHALYPPARVKRRTRWNKLEQRLQVWDMYSELRSFRATASRLGLSSRSVRRAWATALLDIQGRRPEGYSVKSRRVADVTPEALALDWAQCSRCSRADSVDDPKEMCSKHRKVIAAWVGQDARSWRKHGKERGGGSGADEIDP